MKKRNRLIAMLLAGAMVLSMAACGSSDAEDTKVSEEKPASSEVKPSEEAKPSEAEPEDKSVTFPLDETMSFTVATIIQSADNSKLSDSPSMKFALERANIEFDYVAQVANTEVAEKSKLLIAGGDYPDLFFKAVQDADKYGMDGIYIPLEGLIREYAPNCAKYLDDRDAWDDISSPDGHIYAMPTIQYPNTYNGEAPMWINMDWLKAVGKEKPTSLDELYDVLVAFKNEDPNGNGKADEIPMYFDSTVFWTRRFLNYMPDDVVDMSTYLSITDDGLEFFGMSDNYKEDYLGFLRKCYADGLINENCYTEQHKTAKANGKAQELPIYGVMQVTSAGDFVPDGMGVQYDVMEPLGPTGVSMSTGVVGKVAAAITDKCENPEVLVAWMDYFYTEEGANLASLGVEGTHWKRLDDGTYEILMTDDNPGAANGVISQNVKIHGTSNMPGGVATVPRRPNITNSANPAMATQNTEFYKSLEKFAEYVDEGKGAYIHPLNPTAEEAVEVSTLLTDILSYAQNYEAQVVTGQIDLDSTWAEYVQTLKDMQVERVVEVYNTAYSRTYGK